MHRNENKNCKLQTQNFCSCLQYGKFSMVIFHGKIIFSSARAQNKKKKQEEMWTRKIDFPSAHIYSFVLSKKKKRLNEAHDVLKLQPSSLVCVFPGWSIRSRLKEFVKHQTSDCNFKCIFIINFNSLQLIHKTQAAGKPLRCKQTCHREVITRKNIKTKS